MRLASPLSNTTHYRECRSHGRGRGLPVTRRPHGNRAPAVEEEWTSAGNAAQDASENVCSHGRMPASACMIVTRASSLCSSCRFNYACLAIPSDVLWPLPINLFRSVSQRSWLHVANQYLVNGRVYGPRAWEECVDLLHNQSITRTVRKAPFVHE